MTLDEQIAAVQNELAKAQRQVQQAEEGGLHALNRMFYDSGMERVEGWSAILESLEQLKQLTQPAQA